MFVVHLDYTRAAGDSCLQPLACLPICRSGGWLAGPDGDKSDMGVDPEDGIVYPWEFYPGSNLQHHQQKLSAQQEQVPQMVHDRVLQDQSAFVTIRTREIGKAVPAATKAAEVTKLQALEQADRSLAKHL